MSEENKNSPAYQKGADQMNDIYCGIVPPPPQGSGRFTDLMIPYLFGELWNEEILSIRDRRLFTMGIIAAMGEYDVFTIQAMAALKREELTTDQLNELCAHAAPYAGYPRSGGLLGAVGKAIHAVNNEKNK